MISRVRRAAEVMAAAPGCLVAGCRVSGDHQAVVTTGQWALDHLLSLGSWKHRRRPQRRRAPFAPSVSGTAGRVPPERLRCAAVTCILASGGESLRQEPVGGKLERVLVAARAVVGGQEVVADHE